MAKKYYVDLNGKFNEILSDWSECQKYMKEIGGLNFKSFTSYDDAVKLLNEKQSGKIKINEKSTLKKETIAKSNAVNKKDKASSSYISSIDQKTAYIIGCDEVGKVEPFKQMMSVAVFSDPNMVSTVKGGDSKGNSKEKNINIGKTLTNLETYDEVDGNAHYIKEQGIIYCVKILTNKQYNALKESGRNSNLVLSCLHNSALLAVYDEAKKQGFNVDLFVIDDYISKAGDHRVAFSNYIDGYKSGSRKINDTGVDILFTTKAENKFKDTVGIASNIGDYIDHLWQEKCIEDFEKDGIVFDQSWFSNFGMDAQNTINRVFDILKEKYGDVDNAPHIPKHTKYYEEYKRLGGLIMSDNKGE